MLLQGDTEEQSDPQSVSFFAAFVLPAFQLIYPAQSCFLYCGSTMHHRKKKISKLFHWCFKSTHTHIHTHTNSLVLLGDISVPLIALTMKTPATSSHPGPLPKASPFFSTASAHNKKRGESKWGLQYMIGYYTRLVSSWVSRKYQWVSLLLCFIKARKCFTESRPRTDKWYIQITSLLLKCLSFGLYIKLHSVELCVVYCFIKITAWVGESVDLKGIIPSNKKSCV